MVDDVATRLAEGRRSLDRHTCPFPRYSEGETWQGLRKGGTSGIYVIVMALSWWIKAQQTERDDEAWSSVDDVLWVLENMNQTAVSHTAAPKKRARNEGRRDKAESQQRKRSVSTALFVTFTKASMLYSAADVLIENRAVMRLLPHGSKPFEFLK